MADEYRESVLYKLPIVAFVAMTFAAPATAQITISGVGRSGSPDIERPRPMDRGFGREVDRVQDRIEHARDSGQLTPAEARGYRREARMISTLRDRYGRDGLSEAESRDLQTRILALESLVGAPVRPVAGRATP